MYKNIALVYTRACNPTCTIRAVRMEASQCGAGIAIRGWQQSSACHPVYVRHFGCAVVQDTKQDRDWHFHVLFVHVNRKKGRVRFGE